MEKFIREQIRISSQKAMRCDQSARKSSFSLYIYIFFLQFFLIPLSLSLFVMRFIYERETRTLHFLLLQMLRTLCPNFFSHTYIYNIRRRRGKKETFSESQVRPTTFSQQKKALLLQHPLHSLFCVLLLLFVVVALLLLQQRHNATENHDVFAFA